ncbi:MAG: aldo/keto reductase [Elusimicrobia bacterium]|nr:aldo/keto reductase [Elusimicrobiota bacterium]
MKYRNFGKLDWKPSALGFGCMRLPCVDGAPSSPNIDEAGAIKMIRCGIERGINYVDTAYPYHNGNSELVLGKALMDGYRRKVKLATKSPVWLIKKPEDFDMFLNEQLKKLRTDHIDFYLLHALSEERWELVLRFKMLERAQAAIKDGRIGHLGFSFHDSCEAFPKIVDAYDGWTFCQIQYNYMDTDYQAGAKGLKYAASKGLGVIVMEPLRGGALASPPAAVKKVFEAFPKKRTPADWALRWVWNQPEVSLLLSGMGAMAQLEENLRTAGAAEVNSLKAEELALIANARKKLEERTAVPCTRCGYCMPCPNGVNIPFNFELYNAAEIYEDVKAARFRYMRFMDECERAKTCVGCRACVEKCPQKIPISEWMPKVAGTLEEKQEPIRHN